MTVGRDWYQGHTGTSTPETVRAALDQHGVTPADPLDALVVACERRYLDHLDDVREIRWVADLARSLAGRLPIAVASGGMRETVAATLQHLGLADLFACTVTRDDVTEGKPAPEIFLLAAERLGVPRPAAWSWRTPTPACSPPAAPACPPSTSGPAPARPADGGGRYFGRAGGMRVRRRQKTLPSGSPESCC
ncbi:HAD family hydrolase [Kitasatospora sp. NPDC059795]|uniref:HAD family hydrolase n=1 Tax=Kitasatospora sp. NPDC059795 TaxID=3346949 RepID=UPI00364C9CB3